MKIALAPSPNFGPRALGKKISLLILHYTDTATAQESLRLMQSPAHQASAHYLIDEDGAVTRLVEEEHRAWHAGKSYWAGETDVNSCSIGIELQNPGHSHGYRAFPAAQIRAATALCRDIIARHALLPQNILAHSDVAPLRKKDPGELFPWRQLAEDGVGLWPDAPQGEMLTEEKIASLLTRIGYDPAADFTARLTAFQRHYVPESFPQAGKINPLTCARLTALCK